jgi:hypothetical protein
MGLFFNGWGNSFPLEMKDIKIFAGFQVCSGDSTDSACVANGPFDIGVNQNFLDSLLLLFIWFHSMDLAHSELLSQFLLQHSLPFSCDLRSRSGKFWR